MKMTHKAFLEDIKVLMEENGAGHLFKALKEVFYKYIERIMEKQQTGGGLSAGVQGRKGDGGPAYNVGRQNVDARTWPPGHGCQDVATRMWMPGHSHQDVDARTGPPVRGYQDVDSRTWPPERGCQDGAARTWPPGRGSQDVAARMWAASKWLTGYGQRFTVVKKLK